MATRRKPVEVEVEAPPVDDTALGLGSSGVEVEALQTALNATGCRLVVDGEFGGGTRAMVRMFQDHHRLKIDGIVGPETRLALGLPEIPTEDA